MSVHIALDAMSGDHGPSVTVPAALQALADNPMLRLTLVGDQPTIERLLSEPRDRLQIQHATQVVEMDALPSSALRNKKDSSMRVSIDLVKSETVDACVSAGNTGALMATAKFVLKTLPGIDRPAILADLPAIGGSTLMLDLGANADCSVDQLVQFAVMGSVVASAVHGQLRPRVGLLNIGAEEMKGDEIIREAGQRLQRSGLNYIGFVEGNDIFSDRVDVIVSDGFSGNVALKTAEGLGKMIGQFLREEFSRNLVSKLAAAAAMPVLRRFRDRVDPRHHNGASLVGLRGIVIKSHGGADVVALTHAIRIAVLEVEKAVPKRIEALLEEQLR
ncbi:MAG: phosphate acyltransferase PlsX [Gammaproteobacteria bacterium]